MNNADYTKLTRKQLLEQMETERQAWLAAGMSEADIFRIHFGEMDEYGKLRRPKDGGYPSDYFTRLDERKHTRPDRKYAPGTPVAINAIDPDGAWMRDGRGALDNAEFRIDLKAAMDKLTAFQRFCFIEVCVNERTYTEVAKRIGKHHSTIQEAVKAAKERVKKYIG